MPNPRNAIQEMFDDVSLGAPDNAIGFVLWRLVARYQREIDRALLSTNLTHLQFTTLALVAWSGRDQRPVTQVELARSAGIHPMQVSQTLKALEGKQLVLRRQSPTDTRAKQLTVTRRGLTALRSALPRAIAVQQRLFGDPGRPGGALLETLLRLDHTLPPEEV